MQCVNIAQAYTETGKPDSALYYVNQAAILIPKIPGGFEGADLRGFL